MRVSGRRRRFADRVQPCREDGATVAMVALLMVALIGMLALVVDGGAMLLKRRAMVNAADAAALAAAQSFGRHEAECGSNPGPAEAQADAYAVSNVSNAQRVSGYPQENCGQSTVTVRYQGAQQIFFAQVVGIQGDRTVVAEATAKWGGAGTGSSIAPMMLSSNRLSTCDIPDGVAPGDVCSFWWNNSSANQQLELSNAEWGTMDLDKWNVSPTTQCNNSTPPNFNTWLTSGYPTPLKLNPAPAPTYVCRGQGNFGQALNNIILQQRGKILVFPVNDPSKQIDSSGNVCPPGSTTCTVDKYDIVGFARLQVTDLYKGNTPQAALWCPGHAPDPNARCLLTTWVDFSTVGADPGGGQDFGYDAVGLSG